ncbi:Flp pilus assembly protein CpaB [Undibacterium sp. Rencai35W]|uniref:Flp pilus assembly protein CpaB n=1 Tax=Undibacterium sp. Rencai35W TaxID=3413046 RepID=UPI003BF0F17A
MKISKNTLLLGGAVTLGILCFVGAQYYFRTYLSQAEERLAGSYKTKKVVVAAVEIPAGGVLSADNLAVRTIPERYLASTVVDPESLDMVAGQKIMVAVKPGDPIDRGALERADRAALSTTVGVGERAITFPVDEISSISGMLVPGDMIDLLYTGPGTTKNSYNTGAAPTGESTSAGPKDLMHVRLIMQSVPVMATGKTTQKRMVRTENGGQQEVNMDFTTVTLKVNPQQAQQVLIAQKLGQLSAVLRNPDDKGELGKMVLDETTFKMVDGPPAAGVGNYVEMIIGGTGAAGGVKLKSEVGQRLLGDMLGAGRLPASSTEKPQASALDVKNRLGINSPPRAENSPFKLK